MSKVTVADALAHARAYVEYSDAKQYSHAQRSLTLLADAIRALPSWALPPVVEAAAEVERDLVCGAKLTLRNEDGNVILVVRDHDGEVVAPVLSALEGEQLIGDMRRVIAAGKEAHAHTLVCPRNLLVKERDELRAENERLRQSERQQPRVDDESRCAVCGWPLAGSVNEGCVRGNCSQRPRPENLYEAGRG